MANGPWAWARRKWAKRTKEREEKEADRERYKARLEKLRRVAEHVRGLQQSLRPIADGTSTLPREAEYIEEVVPLIGEGLASVGPVRPPETEGIALATIQWAQARRSPVLATPRAPLGADVLVPEIARILEHTDEILFVLARVTVPPRVKRWLDGTVPHHYVPFHDVFNDEVPRRDHRERLLYFMAHNAAGLDNGIISPHAGLIYRHSGGHVVRSWLVVLLLAILTLGVGYVLFWGKIPFAGWDVAFLFPRPPGGTATPYLLPWMGILGGVLVHAIVESEKHALNRGRPPLFSFHLFPRWVDALAGVIFYRGVLSLVALVGMFAFPLEAATPVTAFLVGYSLDSFVGLFGDRLGGMSAKKIEAWKVKDRGS